MSGVFEHPVLWLAAERVSVIVIRGICFLQKAKKSRFLASLGMTSFWFLGRNDKLLVFQQTV
jgi:hypothetical protein